MEQGILQSRYLARFKAWQDNQAIELTGDGLIVERIETEIKTASGIVLSTPSNHTKSNIAVMKPVWVRVLYTGRGYVSLDDEGNKVEEPLAVSPGDICMVGDAAVRWVSAFGTMTGLTPETLGFTRVDQVQMQFKGNQAFIDAFELLNKAENSL